MQIDNTQYSSFHRCEGEWFEKYCLKSHKPFTGDRDDPLAIGIAVHNVLENGYSNNHFQMSEDVAKELNLTTEAMLEVRTMAEAYRNQYPGGPVEFDWIGLEEPLSYTIFNHSITAKVDGFFKVNKAVEVNGGLNDIYLVPGIYAFETKSKAAGYDRSLYIADWDANMQASFQLLTIKANAARLNIDPEEVRGVLVNVIERPKIYEPRRTCKACDKLIEVKYYRLNGKIYHCPLCDYGNTFTGTIGTARVDPPFLYRFLIERGSDRLQQDENIILQTANSMHFVSNNKQPTYNRTNCVNMQWRKKCEYYEPHNSYVPVTSIGYPGYAEFNPTAYLENKNKKE